jgi:hypothetical protein
VSGLTSKPLVRFVSGLASKPVVTIFSSLASKLVATVSPGLASKPVVGFLVSQLCDAGLSVLFYKSDSHVLDSFGKRVCGISSLCDSIHMFHNI